MNRDRAARYRAQGFTLVELMIALAVGLVLVIVVAQLFLGSRRTFTTTDEVSRMQENIRFTYQLLSRTIHLGGYKSSPNTRVEDVFNAATPVLVGTEGATASDSDGFSIRFQGNSNGTGPADNSTFDCLGLPVAAGVMAVNTFTIALGRNGSNALFCNNGTTNAEIIPDVENMQVLYGVDNDSNLVVDTYAPAASVPNMNLVRSVRVALLFRSTNTAGLPAPSIRTFDLNGVTFGPFNDNLLRRSVTMTVNMRNRTP